MSGWTTSKPKALPGWWRISTGVHAGGCFEDRQVLQMMLIEGLQQGPGEAARAEMAVGASSPVPARWTLRTIRATFEPLAELTLSGVWRTLQRCGLRLRSSLVQHHSPDTAYARKVRCLLRSLSQAAHDPREVSVVFLDEFGYYRWPDPAPSWGCDPAIATRAHANAQWRTIGALNALTGQVDYLDNYVVGRRQVIAFYRQLDRTYADVGTLYIVQDNWNIHTHPDVTAALQSMPRLVPVWLPTYAPWLNPIEKLWRWLRHDVLKMHRLVEDWPAVRQAVRGFLDQFRHGSLALLRYVGLLGEGKLARACRAS